MLAYCAFHVLVRTNFRRYYLYFLPNQALQILLDHFNVLDELLGEISTGFDNRWIISPHCKNCPRYNVAESGQFFTMVVHWDFFYEIWHQTLSKTWNDRGEFELDPAKGRNTIADKSIAIDIGHETHNKFYSVKVLKLTYLYFLEKCQLTKLVLFCPWRQFIEYCRQCTIYKRLLI